MPNILNLHQGAERVLPVTVRRFEAGQVSLESLRITRFAGTRMVVASGPVTSSGQFPGTPSRYICQAAFYAVEDVNAGPSINGRVGVRCACEGYRFFFDYSNRRAGASYGARFLPYVRKTTWMPPKNPDLIPGACVAKGTLVPSSRGLLPIEKIRVGDYVSGLLGETLVVETSELGEKDILAVGIDAGYELKVTPDHRIQVINGDGLAWKEAKDLESGDLLIGGFDSFFLNDYVQIEELNISDHYKNICKRLSPDSIDGVKLPKVLNEDLAEILGHLISEGCGGVFCNECSELKEHHVNLLRNVFGNVKTAQPIFIKEFFKSIGYDYEWGSYEKVIPEFIFRSPRTVISSFLKGLYAGDGWINKNFSTYATVSETLAVQLQQVLYMFRINSRITENYSGVNSSRVYLLRTSSLVETEKLKQLFTHARPIESSPLLIDRDFCFSGYTKFPQYILNKLVEDAILKDLKEEEDNAVGVFQVIELQNAFGCMTRESITDFYRSETLKKERVEGVKKPYYYIALGDFLRAHRASRLSKFRLCDRFCKNPYQENVTFRKVMEGFDKPFPFVGRNLQTTMEFVKTLIGIHYFHKVSYTRPAGKSMVYDIGTESETFMANNVVVHNCKHLLTFFNALTHSNFFREKK
jgi:intein/homing endonuclease